MRLMGASEAGAEEAAQQAVEQFFEKLKDWSPSTPTQDGLMQQLKSKTNGIVINLVRKRQRRGDAAPLKDPPSEGKGDTPDACQETDEWQYAILDRIDGDEDACTLFDLAVRGVEEAGEQIRELGWPPGRVYEARRRLRVAVKLELYGKSAKASVAAGP